VTLVFSSAASKLNYFVEHTSLVVSAPGRSVNSAIEMTVLGRFSSYVKWWNATNWIKFSLSLFPAILHYTAAALGIGKRLKKIRQYVFLFNVLKRVLFFLERFLHPCYRKLASSDKKSRTKSPVWWLPSATFYLPFDWLTVNCHKYGHGGRLDGFCLLFVTAGNKSDKRKMRFFYFSNKITHEYGCTFHLQLA